MAFTERRKYPRVPETVPCHLTVGPSAFMVQTQNLSCGGALCKLNIHLPLMTKLKVALQLPRQTPIGGLSQPIHCEGVVVRQELRREPEGSVSYSTAIYFSQLSIEDRRRIAEFVLQSMLSHGRRRS